MDAAADALQIPESPRPGDEVGVYKLLEELGAGGMGKVFLAEHVKLGRRVAIKVLQPELWHNRRSVQRFFQEARLVNRIDHENIVQIHDYVQEADGLSYFIMELLVGRDLTQSRERSGPFSLSRTLRILRQIASALAAAHAQGVVHRDLKPGNIFLVQKPGRVDFVKLLDFGIAKLQDDADMEAPRTRTGTIVGTPLYMSPEQASGERVDARSDLYSLGVVAYWMLSDAFPFKAKSFAELIAKQQSQPPLALPNVTAGGENIPPSLARIIERCLKRNPRDRFQDAAAFDAAMEKVCATLPAIDPIPMPVLAGTAPRGRKGLFERLQSTRAAQLVRLGLPHWRGVAAALLVFFVGGTVVLGVRYRQRHLTRLPETTGAPVAARPPPAQTGPAVGPAAVAVPLDLTPRLPPPTRVPKTNPRPVAAALAGMRPPARPTHPQGTASAAVTKRHLPQTSDDDDVLDPYSSGSKGAQSIPH